MIFPDQLDREVNLVTIGQSLPSPPLRGLLPMPLLKSLLAQNQCCSTYWFFSFVVCAVGCKEPPVESKSDLVREAPIKTPSETPVITQKESATPLPKVSDDDFFEAATNGDASVVKRGIRQGIPVDAATEEKRTALMLASYNGFAAIVDYLLKHKAMVDARDNMNRTALMYASTGPFAETVQLLIDAGANVNAADGQENWTPLMFAAAEGQADVVKILLKHGATTANRDADGDTALQFALSKGHQEVADLISISAK